MGGEVVNVRGITNADMSATINGAVKAGWVHLGTKSGHTVGQIQWPATGAIVNYSTTPKAGGWKTVAQMIYAASGVDLRRKGSNRRSRKPTGYVADPAIEASRRRHAETFEAKADERDAAKQAEMRRRADAERTAAAERRRREIEELMRP